MRAGGSPPATPYRHTLPSKLGNPFNEGRGFTPGDTRNRVSQRVVVGSFNEGRGFTPGDTYEVRETRGGRYLRSMRAGGSPPATRSTVDDRYAHYAASVQ